MPFRIRTQLINRQVSQITWTVFTMETGSFTKGTGLLQILKYATHQRTFMSYFATHQRIMFPHISACCLISVSTITMKNHMNNKCCREKLHSTKTTRWLLSHCFSLPTKDLHLSANEWQVLQHQAANPVLDLAYNQCLLPASMASHHSSSLYAKGLLVPEMILVNPLHTTNYVAT